MNREEFIASIESTYKKGVSIVKMKNADYANSDDPFKNFRSAEIVGLTVERAILVRVLDKITRISNLLGKEADVKEESLEDSCLDMINYMAIFVAYRESNKK